MRRVFTVAIVLAVPFAIVGLTGGAWLFSGLFFDDSCARFLSVIFGVSGSAGALAVLAAGGWLR